MGSLPLTARVHPSFNSHLKMRFRSNFQMGNRSRQKLNDLLKATLCWNRDLNCSRSVNVSAAGMKNMAILLFSAFFGNWGLFQVHDENMYLWHVFLWCCCLMDGIWKQKGLQRLHCLWLSLAKCEMTHFYWYYHINCFNFFFFSVIHLGWKNRQKDPHCLILLRR